MQYKNPIIPGYYPDPSICRVGENFYLVTSSFEYFPGVPIFHSKDLINWQQIGYCLMRPSQVPLAGCWASGGIWAPTIRHHNGLFYMTTTNTTGGGHFYVTTPDPAGAWSEPIWVEGNGWDSSLFFDDDGKAYFQWFEYDPFSAIYQTEIDIATGQHLTKPKVVWQGTGGRSPEGPHLYKINGCYYLLAAEGGTEEGHMVTLARGDSPWGPWEACPHNPILSHRSLDHPIQTTGHGDLVEDTNGNWWIVFLGTRPVGYPRYHILGRETFLAPVLWKDGWPVVGNHGTTDLEVEAPLPDLHSWEQIEPLRDDFDTQTFGWHWNWLRNPDMANYSLSERPGWLRLKGIATHLDAENSPTFLGRRQRYFNCRVITEISFDPQNKGEEAGLVVLGDNHHHYEIAVRFHNGQREIIVRRRIGALQAIVAQETISEGNILLSVEADPTWYTFSFSLGNHPWKTLTQGETRYLCTESGAAKFTGVYFGMYATGHGKPCSAPADFAYFEIDPLE
jgi:alpha-N-arabinofuranosidase